MEGSVAGVSRPPVRSLWVVVAAVLLACAGVGLSATPSGATTTAGSATTCTYGLVSSSAHPTDGATLSADDGHAISAAWIEDVVGPTPLRARRSASDPNPRFATNSAPIWSSADPLVGNLANQLEAAFPGRITGVNTNVPMSNGLLREVDIELGDIVVQVKSGNARGLTGQIETSVSTTGRRVVGYAPDMPPGAWENAARQGIPIARSLDELIAIIRELG